MSSDNSFLSRKTILFDVSILGDAHHSNLSKTGIARVAENLLKHFARQHSIRICPITFTGNAPSCYQFIRSEIGTNGLDMSFLIGNSLIHQFTYKLFLSETKIRNAEKSSQSKWVTQGLRALKNTVKQARNLLSNCQPRTADLLNSTNNLFYLSTASGPPSVIRRNPEIQIGVIVHDTIPITHTQYCKESSTPHWYRKLIDELSPKDHIFCVSNSTRNDLLRVCPMLSSSQVHVFHLAAKESFHPEKLEANLNHIHQKYNIPDRKPIALSVGTIEPRKNLDGLIRAFESHLKENPQSDLHLVLSGAIGWKVDRMIDEIAGISLLKERLIMTGFVDEEDLPDLYRIADFFIFPSHYEGFGLPVLEAMQCGLPVICSNTSSLPEVGGEAAYYVNPKNTNEISQAITHMHHDGHLRAQLSHKSIQQAAQFTWDGAIEIFLKTIACPDHIPSCKAN